jgi:hypothetical protein
MGILAKIFGPKDTDGPMTIHPAGVVENSDGWYYEESQDYSSSQRTLRIDQDRPGDWYVHTSFCEINGLNDPSRADDARRFFAGSYRWLDLERDRSDRRHPNRIKVMGTFRDKGGKERTLHLGYLTRELADELTREDLEMLWGRIRFIRFPRPDRKPQYWIRFDLMKRLADDTFEKA